jgi:hypothetical protein
MNWIFINLTSYAGGRELCGMLEAAEAAVFLCEQRKNRILTSVGWKRFSRPVTDAIYRGARKCNWIDAHGSAGVIAGTKVAQLRVQVAFAANAFCWDRVEPGVALDAASRGNKVEWETLMPLLGIQKLAGVEPSVCSIVIQTQDSISPSETWSILEDMLYRGLSSLSGFPEDLKVYGRRGDSAFADGGMNIVFRSRTHEPRYDRWPGRFLQPREWLGANKEVATAIARKMNLEMRLVCREGDGAGLAEIGLVYLGKLADDPECLRDAVPDSFVFFADPNKSETRSQATNLDRM